MKKNKILRAALCSMILVLSLATPSFADAGIPMIFIEWPLAIVMLIPVILIETIIFKRGLKQSYAKTGLAVGVANLLTTILGYPLKGILELVLGLPFMYFIINLLQHIGEFLPSFISGGLYLFGILFTGIVPPEGGGLFVLGLFQLFLAFLLSVYFESHLIRKYFFKSEDKKKILSLTWKANACSYSLLVVIWVVWFWDAIMLSY